MADVSRPRVHLPPDLCPPQAVKEGFTGPIPLIRAPLPGDYPENQPRGLPRGHALARTLGPNWPRRWNRVLQARPVCQVDGCGRPSSVVYHMQNPGISLKDDRRRNLRALCQDHHAGKNGIHPTGKLTWARRFKILEGGQYRAELARLRRLHL